MEKERNNINWKYILWYFIIFSIFGLIIETIFCYVTTGVIESRKGLIWGPFCPVYGVGATILILILNQYKNSNVKLFVIGCILGNVIEYILSYILESIYGTRFWDYSFLNWNLNGRICFTYSIFWGILSVLLIKVIKKQIDHIVSKIPNSQGLHIGLITFLVIDAICTVWAVISYQERISIRYQGIEKENTLKTKIEEKLFSDQKMVTTFPNLRYIDKNGTEYYIRDMLIAD